MTVNDPFGELRQLLFENQQHIEALEESLSTKMLDLEDIGWTLISGGKPQDDDGPDLDTLQKLVPNLLYMAATNPLFVRGASLRHAYIFGRGINISNIDGKAQKAFDEPYNQETLFSMDAYERLNLAKFTDGNVFVIRNEVTNVCTLVPITQIKAEVTDPEDTSRVRYFL